MDVTLIHRSAAMRRTFQRTSELLEAKWCAAMEALIRRKRSRSFTGTSRNAESNSLGIKKDQSDIRIRCLLIFTTEKFARQEILITGRTAKMSIDTKIVVSPEDQKLLDEPGWFISGNGYVMREIRPTSDGKRRCEYLHRVILGAGDYQEDYQVVDHIDGNKLNNRRDNIRLTNNGSNCQRGKKPFRQSGYIGVSKKRNKWQAKTQNRSLGVFGTPEEAAAAYNNAVKRIFGEHCLVNELPHKDCKVS